eukprot:7256385-Prymnesium_polylepis.2
MLRRSSLFQPPSMVRPPCPTPPSLPLSQAGTAARARAATSLSLLHALAGRARVDTLVQTPSGRALDGGPGRLLRVR